MSTGTYDVSTLALTSSVGFSPGDARAKRMMRRFRFDLILSWFIGMSITKLFELAPLVCSQLE